MVNEIKVAELKQSAHDLENALRERYFELIKNGEESSVINELVDYVNKLLAVRKEVNVENFETYEKRLKRIKREVNKKFGVELIENLPVEEVTKENEESDEVEVISVDEPKEKLASKKYKTNFAALFLATVIGLGAGFGLGSCNKKNSNEQSEEETIERNEQEQVEDSINLIVGKFVPLNDVTDDKQVEARAQYIYDNYYARFMNSLSENERSFITVDRIADTIRVVNGHCPKDENGYKVLDANTHLTYGQALTELVSNIPSSRELQNATGNIAIVPGFLFAEDGSEVQEFIKSYDELYARVAEGRNTNNSKEYRAAGKILAAKYWSEWFLQGMGGNILYNTATDEIAYANDVRYEKSLGKYILTETVFNEATQKNEKVQTILENTEVYPIRNPYNYDANLRFLAYQSTMTRYPSYIKEAEFNQMATICVPACINYSTKQVEELGIHEIFTAIDDGVWNDIIARSAGMEAPKEPVMLSFLNDLANQLEYDYNHTKTLKLN